MPKIQFAGQTIDCPQGANLRVVLLRARLPLYTFVARAIHCRGHGTCGTCAVKVEGQVSAPTSVEQRRMRFPPHQADTQLRLACQCTVLGDLIVTKYDGLFGQHADAPAEPKRPGR